MSIRVALLACMLLLFVPRHTTPQQYDLCDADAIAGFVDASIHKGGTPDCTDPIVLFLDGCVNEPALKSRRQAMLSLSKMCKALKLPPPPPSHHNEWTPSPETNFDLCDTNAIKKYVDAAKPGMAPPDCSAPVAHFLSGCLQETALKSRQGRMIQLVQYCKQRKIGVGEARDKDIAAVKHTATIVDCLRNMGKCCKPFPTIRFHTTLIYLFVADPISVLMDNGGTCCPPGLWSKSCNKLRNVMDTKGYWRPCSAACGRTWIPWWNECRQVMYDHGLLSDHWDRQKLLRISRETKEFETKCRKAMGSGH